MQYSFPYAVIAAMLLCKPLPAASKTTGTPKLTFSLQAKAPHMQLARILESTQAYNIAYKWNRFGQIKNWDFAEDNTPSSVHGMRCAHAEFVAMLALPSVFKDYLPLQSAYDVHMHKKMCVQGSVLTEMSRVDDVSFFTDFNIIEISRLQGGSVSTDVEVYYNVPWYLMFLQSNINAYLQQSVQDRLRIMYDTLSGEE